MKGRQSKCNAVVLIIGAYCTLNFWIYTSFAGNQRCATKEIFRDDSSNQYQPRILTRRSHGITDSLLGNLTLPTPPGLRPLEKTTKVFKSHPLAHTTRPTLEIQHPAKTLPVVQNSTLGFLDLRHQNVKDKSPEKTWSNTGNLTKVKPNLQRQQSVLLDSWGDLDSIRDVLFRGIHDPFHERTLKTCVNKCHPANAICNITSHDVWVRFNNAHKLPLVKLFGDDQRFFPWERDYLPLPPMTDGKTLPDVNRSVLRLATKGHPQTANSVSCELGQTLTFQLDLYDNYGRPRTHGKDRVLAWTIGYFRKGQNETYRAANRVKDMGNGSYEIHVSCLWVGAIKLRVGVVYPREYLRLVFQHFRSGSHRFMTGLFKVGDVEEVTICFGLPNIPGRPCLCNFTSLNGIPFYCGRPLDNRLTCEDLQATQQLNNIPMKNFTEAEAAMADTMSRPLNTTLVKHSFAITVWPNAKTSNDKSLASRKCDKSFIPKTWDDDYPHGFFDKNDSWTSLICQEPDIDKQEIQECLRDKTILMIGDTNMLYLHQSLKLLIKCHDNKTVGQWAAHSVCKTWTSNTMVHYVPHEYPLYQHPKWNPLVFQGGVARILDTFVPSEGSHVVLYHVFLHSTSSHLSTLFLGLHSAKQAFKRLLHRNPRVLIGVRGPHVASMQWPKNHLFWGDVQGTFARAIFRQVFRELWDRVVFLDGWEMTTAMENENLYPPQYVANAMMKSFLSFYCE